MTRIHQIVELYLRLAPVILREWLRLGTAKREDMDMTASERETLRILIDSRRRELVTPPRETGYDYFESRQLTREPTERNRTYRASDNCWNRGMSGRTVGVATDDHGNPLTREPSVSVTTSDGRTRVVSTDQFRRARHVTRRRQNAQVRRVESESARMAHIIGYTGNVE